LYLIVRVTNPLGKQIQIVSERDGKTNSWMTVDGTASVSIKYNCFKDEEK
jgi:hypothetical protein